MSMIHIYRHHNSRIQASTLTSLAYLNVILDALVEQIMAAFILSSATRNKIAIGLSNLHVITSV